MSSSEDKCEISEDKYKDRRKYEIFPRSDKLDRGHKGKSTASRGVYKEVVVEDAEGRNFFLLRA